MMEGKEYFNQIAKQWDKMRQSFFSEKVRETAYAIANVQAGELAADIGAGTGFITEGLLKRGLRVIAVDQSDGMLEEMKAKFGKFNTVDYRVVESDRLPIDEKSLDCVFANMFLHHVETPPDAIREMARVLRVGGRAVITDLDEHVFEFLKTEQHDRWMGFKRNDVKHWFEEAGLKKVVVGCAGESCCAESSTGSENATISIFVACGEK